MKPKNKINLLTKPMDDIYQMMYDVASGKINLKEYSKGVKHVRSNKKNS